MWNIARKYTKTKIKIILTLNVRLTLSLRYYWLNSDLHIGCQATSCKIGSSAKVLFSEATTIDGDRLRDTSCRTISYNYVSINLIDLVWKSLNFFMDKLRWSKVISWNGLITPVSFGHSPPPSLRIIACPICYYFVPAR